MVFLIFNTDLCLHSSITFCKEITIFSLITIRVSMANSFLLWKQMTDSRFYIHPHGHKHIFWFTGYIRLLSERNIKKVWVWKTVRTEKGLSGLRNQVLCYACMFPNIPWHSCHTLEKYNPVSTGRGVYSSLSYASFEPTKDLQLHIPSVWPHGNQCSCTWLIAGHLLKSKQHWPNRKMLDWSFPAVTGEDGNTPSFHHFLKEWGYMIDTAANG